MPKDGTDQSELHDALGQNAEENEQLDEVGERIADAEEVMSAEESAINTDNETAEEASGMTAGTDKASAELEAEAKLVDEAYDRKHKNRESTSEKAKKAATERQTKGESTTGALVSARTLDPLRLRGKKYRAAVAMLEKDHVYGLEEAIALVKKTSTSTFDAAVEAHVRIKGEAVRGTVVLPQGTGKSKKVGIADDATIEAIAAGNLDFDILIATPAQMPKLAKYAKLLGPKGLMPSPKAGTVTDDLEKTAKEIGGGRIEYRADRNGVVHVAIGRVSFSDEHILENYRALEAVITVLKMQAVSLASTMGPGVKVAFAK